MEVLLRSQDESIKYQMPDVVWVLPINSGDTVAFGR